MSYGFHSTHRINTVYMKNTYVIRHAINIVELWLHHMKARARIKGVCILRWHHHTNKPLTVIAMCLAPVHMHPSQVMFTHNPSHDTTQSQSIYSQALEKQSVEGYIPKSKITCKTESQSIIYLLMPLHFWQL